MSESSCGYNQSNVHDFDTVKTNGKLNIGFFNALRGAFDLGVKYTKDIVVTVTTAEMTVMVDLGLSAFEKIVNKVGNMKELQPFGDYLAKFVDYKLKFLDSDLKIVEYLGYEYLLKSYRDYVDAIQIANTIGLENPEDQFNNFLKNFSPNAKINIPFSPNGHMNTQPRQPGREQHTQSAKNGSQHLGGGHLTPKASDDAFKIADRIIDQILLLPLHLQLDELVKIVNNIKNVAETKHMRGGGVNELRINKKSRKHRGRKRRKAIKKTRKMIYNSIKTFTN